MLLNSQKEIEARKNSNGKINSCRTCMFFSNGQKHCSDHRRELCNDFFLLTLDEVNTALSVPQRFRPAITKNSEAWGKFNNGKNLFLYGPTGTGKTHEAFEIAKCFYIRNYPDELAFGLTKKIIYISEGKFFTKLKDFRMYSREKEYARLFQADLIIWDEFGDADGEQSERYRLINEIYIKQQPRVIFATNQDISTLPGKIGSKTADRLYDICQGGSVEFSGKSLRGKRTA